MYEYIVCMRTYTFLVFLRRVYLNQTGSSWSNKPLQSWCSVAPVLHSPDKCQARQSQNSNSPISPTASYASNVYGKLLPMAARQIPSLNPVSSTAWAKESADSFGIAWFNIRMLGWAQVIASCRLAGVRLYAFTCTERKDWVSLATQSETQRFSSILPLQRREAH